MSSTHRTRHGSRDKSPAALLQRRQRAFVVGGLVGLAIAVVIGFLLPVGDMKADHVEITRRGSQH